MDLKRIERAITKYLVQEADFDDLDNLSEWIQIPENQIVFKNYVEIYYKTTLAMSKLELEEVKRNLLQQIKKDQKKGRKIAIRKKAIKYAAAAVIATLVALGYMFWDIFFDNTVGDIAPAVVNTDLPITPGTDKATLTLEDGSHVALEKGAPFQIQNASSNGEEIFYRAVQEKTVEVVYNYLTIPRGGKFVATLSDGTKVWLNSESQLKFPVNFVDGETRTVTLVYGEAYFEVSPSRKHNGTEFRVINGTQEIQVLGTEFNVKAYKDEPNALTTLAEGSVVVTVENKKRKLVPGQQFDLDVNTNTSTIKTVDVYNEISWKDGIFSFKGKPLKDIMKVLSRWYDIDVVFENKAMETVTFKGVLGKDQDIGEILATIKTLSVLKAYEINNRVVILK